MTERAKDRLCILIGLLFGTIAFGLVVLDAYGQELIEPTPQEYADIKTWIPQACCWTQNCCKKVAPSAFTPVSRDDYIVNATGQKITRHGWSQDGNTWRCTCDFIEGLWVVSVKAKTHCIFPAPAGH